MVSEKSKKNLKKGTIKDSERANELRLIGLKKRRAKAEQIAVIDSNLDNLLALLDGVTTKEEFDALVENVPNQFLRIYLQELKDPAKARPALEKLIDRIKGTPVPAEPLEIKGDIQYKFKFGDE